jgi:hypothetical protein
VDHIIYVGPGPQHEELRIYYDPLDEAWLYEVNGVVVERSEAEAFLAEHRQPTPQ